MKKIFVMYLMGLVTFSSTIISQSNSTVVLKSSDLEFISVTRLSDIFSILPQLDVYTIDRYRHSVSDGNIFLNAPKDITLLINGTRTNFGLWNKTNISQFPVHPGSIDSIIISFAPTSYGGEFSSGVLIDIVTKKNTEGISLTGTYATGNEAGDPGPYRYTEYFSGNVDQFGPNTLFSAGYGNDKLNLTFSFIDHVSPATDPAILNRVSNFIFQNYQVRYFGSSINMKASSGIGRHNLFTSYSKSGEAVLGYEYGADLIFIDEISSEIPYQSESILISSGNEIEIDNEKKLFIDLNLNHTIAEQSEFTDEFTLSSEDLWLYSKAGYKSSIGLLNFNVGSSYTYHNIKNRHIEFDHSRNIASFYASMNFEAMENLFTQVDLNFRSARGSSGLFVRMENMFRLSSKHSFTLTLSFDSLFNIQNSINYRMSKGIPFLNNSVNQTYSYDTKAVQNAISLGYAFTPDEKNTITTGLALTNSSNLAYLLNNFIYNSDEMTIENIQPELFGSVNGWEGEFSLSLTNRVFSNFQHKFYYRYKNSLSGHEILRQALKRIPLHKIFYSVYYSPFADLAGSLTLIYSSPSQWIEYRNINSNEDDLYLSKLKSIFIVNCSVTKKFWQGKIKINAGIENLLNNRIQFHPVGGSFDLTFFLKAEALLESIIKF